MSQIKTNDVVYEYVERDEDGNASDIKRALDHISLDVEKGQFIAILGANGSGKSTLAKHINALLLPTEGNVLVCDMDTSNDELLPEIRKRAGMVFQNPDNQIIATVVEEDVGFGPENLGVPTEEIQKRVDECLKAVRMTEYRDSSPNRLSGGQKQRVAIAGILAMEPECILMDEPTAMLDPGGRREVIETAKRLNREKNITVILITHYMEEVIDADRVIVMNHGRVAMTGTPKEIFARVEELRTLRLEVPQVTELAFELSQNGIGMKPAILTEDEFMEEFAESAERLEANANTAASAPEADKREADKRALLCLNNVSYVYGEHTAYEKKALQNVSLEFHEGEFVGLIGHTGSGKSTLIQLLNGLERATSGQVTYDGTDIFSNGYNRKQLRSNVGLVFQYPDYQLFETTIMLDVSFGPKNLGLTEEEIRERSEWALDLVGVDRSLWDSSPLELSGGQKRRVAIAGVLAMKPKVLILDEPTAGLDPKGRDEILEEISKIHRETGMTVILVSHRMEDVARFANRLIVINDGTVAFDATPREVFRKESELTKMGLEIPEVTRLMHQLAAKGFTAPTDAITVEEAVQSLTALYGASR